MASELAQEMEITLDNDSFDTLETHLSRKTVVSMRQYFKYQERIKLFLKKTGRHVIVLLQSHPDEYPLFF